MLHKVLKRRLFASKNLKLLIAKVPGDCPSCGGDIGLVIPEYREIYFCDWRRYSYWSSLFFDFWLFNRGWSEVFPIFAARAFLIGFLGSELIGIHTGYLYGDYVYGTLLWGQSCGRSRSSSCELVFILVYLKRTIFHKVTMIIMLRYSGLRPMTLPLLHMEPVAVAIGYVGSWKFEIIRWVIMPLVYFRPFVQLIFRKANLTKAIQSQIFFWSAWSVFAV